MPMKTTRMTGPTTIRVMYSLTRRAKLRACWTRQRKLKLSSTFLMVPTSVHARSAKPTEPTTPPLTLLANSITREVSSAAPSGPSALKSS